LGTTTDFGAWNFIGIGSKLWREPVNPWAGNCRVLFILSVSKAIIITKALSKKYSTKIILPILCKFYEVPNWMDVPNLIILSFFLSLEILKKRVLRSCIKILWIYFKGYYWFYCTLLNYCVHMFGMSCCTSNICLSSL
jgi:hypothetical protein